MRAQRTAAATDQTSTARIHATWYPCLFPKAEGRNCAHARPSAPGRGVGWGGASLRVRWSRRSAGDATKRPHRPHRDRSRARRYAQGEGLGSKREWQARRDGRAGRTRPARWLWTLQRWRQTACTPGVRQQTEAPPRAPLLLPRALQEAQRPRRPSARPRRLQSTQQPQAMCLQWRRASRAARRWRRATNRAQRC